MLGSLSDGIDQDKLLQEAAGWLQVEWCLTTTRLLPIFDEELGWRGIMSRRCSQTGVGLRMQALVEEVARRARHRCVAYVVKSGAGCCASCASPLRRVCREEWRRNSTPRVIRSATSSSCYVRQSNVAYTV